MKRWLKLDFEYPHGSTACKIRDRFGRDGLLVWVLLLAAAKRNVPEGELSYTSDPHFWNLLGLTGIEPDFTPDMFLTYTGHLKQTSRRRSGATVKTFLTHWKEWQKDWRRDDERERMSRNRQGFDANTLRTESERRANEKRTEKEREIETKPPLPPQGGNGSLSEKELLVYNRWRTVCRKTDPRYDKPSPGRVRKIRARLKEFSSDDLLRALDAVVLDPWEERSQHNDLTVLFRNQEQVDRFLSIGADVSLRSRESRVRDHLQSLQDE